MDFDDEFRARLRDLMVWRRDVRRFRTDPLPAGTLERLITTACLAPSVGLSQPWRFVIVDSPVPSTKRKSTGWISDVMMRSRSRLNRIISRCHTTRTPRRS